MGWTNDVRYAARALRGSPGYTLIAALTMCLGIGATTGVYSVVNAVVLRPLAFPDSARIVALLAVRGDSPRADSMSLEEIQDWKRQSQTLTALCGWRDWGMDRSDTTPHEGVYGVIATPELFRVFPMQPVLGRLFTAAEDTPGHNRVVVLTYPYWRERFGGRRDVVGARMELERGPRAGYTVIGVLPPEFSEVPSFDGVQVVAPSSIDPDASTGRGHRNRSVFARLAPGTNLAAAQAEARVIAAALAKQYPESNRDVDARVVTAVENEVGAVGDTLRALLAAVTLVLLIASGNVAGLQLVRALARRREFSIRQALGGSRASIVRAMLAESVLVSLGAAAAGVILASWVVELVLAAGPQLPRITSLRFDGAVFTFAFGVCLGAAVLAALPAAVMTTRLDLARALREESASIARALRARTLFVGGQIALALVLLTGAILAAETLAAQLRVNPGFDPSAIGVVRIAVPLERSGADVAALYARILEQVRALPGVRGASAVSAPPLWGEGPEPAPFHLEGEAPRSHLHHANTFNAAPGYFSTLGVPLLRGRDLQPDDAAGSPAIAVVNDAFARTFFPGSDAVGRVVRVGEEPGEHVRIVGVAADLRQQPTPRSTAEPEIYWPYTQHPRWAAFVIVRSDQPGATAALVKARIAATDPAVRLGTTAVLADRLARSVREPRFVTLLFGVFAGVALLLSAIGVAGLVFYSLAQRTKEIAVRVSLGATRADVISLVARGAFRAVLVGSLIGVAGSVVIWRLLGSMLHQLGPLTPVTVAVAWALLVAVGLLASYLPSRRALRLNPADALRLD